MLDSLSVLRPASGALQRKVVTELLLTALVDAFSILVIFLLMSFSSTGEILFVGRSMELPKSNQAGVLERYPVVKVERGQIFLEDQLVPAGRLEAALMELHRKLFETQGGQDNPGILTIQADRRSKYDELNQVVVAAGRVGFNELRFAVLMGSADEETP
ncbi:MAG: biopolymer transporter ExbD [Bdellovibrio sp.]|nr:MAG: biopolymer transporter ExbD [Bdellovibrio sp.]